jgi:hypothetical protein
MEVPRSPGPAIIPLARLALQAAIPPSRPRIRLTGFLQAYRFFPRSDGRYADRFCGFLVSTNSGLYFKMATNILVALLMTAMGLRSKELGSRFENSGGVRPEIMDSRQSQSGIPTVLLVVALVVAFAAPRLPVMFRKGLMIAGMLVWIGGLYYLVLAPRWWPGNRSPARRMCKRILLLLLAGVVGITTGAFVTAAPGTAS